MESIFSEDWVLSNVLSAADLYQDELQGYNGGPGDLLKPLHLTNELNPNSSHDSGITDDFDSWLEEATSLDALDTSLLPPATDAYQSINVQSDMLAQLEAALDPDSPVGSFEAQADFMLNLNHTQFNHLNTKYQLEVPEVNVPVSPMRAPSSPIEMTSLSYPNHGSLLMKSKPLVKYVRPSTIDVSALSSHAQIVMDDLNILHLPEPSEDQAALMLLEALNDPNLAEQLCVTEVESLLSTPPSSPEALVPEVPSYESDDDYKPSRKRKSTSPGCSSRSLKTMKPVERRERKKIQNKNAATKYRVKKREEEEEFKSELTQLESKNSNLRRKVEDLSQEIKYMKDLLNESLKGKGLRIQ